MSEGFSFNHQFRFIWHTALDHPPDPLEICSRLNGKTFNNQSLYQHILFDPFYGDIWDLDNDLPLTHPNCKCFLEVTYESSLDELLNIKPDGFKEFKIMTSNIKEMKAELSDFDRDLARASSRIENTKFQLLTYMALLHQLGLPPEAEKIINILTRIRMTMELTTRSAYLLMAASGPLGWGMAAASAGVSIISFYGLAAEIGGQ